MTLDLIHDVLLGVSCLSLLLVVTGIVLRRRPHEPECPICLYAHGMAEAATCPECGHSPAASTAWLRVRPRLPRRLRRWNLIAVGPLTLALATIGTLHGRWATVLPGPVFVESLRLLSWSTPTGQTRTLNHAVAAHYTRATADRLVLIAFEAVDPDNTVTGSTGRPIVLTPTNWRAQLCWTAIGLRSAGEHVVVDHRHLGVPGQRATHGAFFASSSACAQPEMHEALIRMLDAGGYEQQLATWAIQSMHDRARPMSRDLLLRLAPDPTRRGMLAAGFLPQAGLFDDPIALREAFDIASAAQQEAILTAAFRCEMMGELPRASREVIRRFRESMRQTSMPQPMLDEWPLERSKPKATKTHRDASTTSPAPPSP